MKRTGLILAITLCSAALLYAGENKGKDMSGWICNSKCVAQTDSKAVCDKNCSETEGDLVFISDKGEVSKIENQDKVKSSAGKKVKMKASMNKEKEMMYVYEIAPATY